MIQLPRCPLCQTDTPAEHYHQDRKLEYLQCPRCHLVYVHPSNLPSKDVEKLEYSLHENSADDEGYVRFLSRLLHPLQPYLSKQVSVIDFGCGPEPVLAQLMEQKGAEVALYDPFFANRPENLTRQYHIITCTEAIEHFHQPHKEWALWLKMLKPNGMLAIMTKRVIDKTRFAQWHYKNDPTHVSFFSEVTFTYLAEQHGFIVEFPSNDVVFMKKV